MEKVSANNRPNIEGQQCIGLKVRFEKEIILGRSIGAVKEEMEYHPYIGETPKYGCKPIC
jgi:hypothetical protein